MCFWDSRSNFIGQTFDGKLLRKIQIFGISDLGKDFNILRKWWRREARQRCLSSSNDAPWRSGPSWLRFHKDLKVLITCISNNLAKNHQNIKKFMTVEKNFSKSAIWDQSRLSSSICLEVMIIWTQTWYLIFKSFTHLGVNYLLSW